MQRITRPEAEAMLQQTLEMIRLHYGDIGVDVEKRLAGDPNATEIGRQVQRLYEETMAETERAGAVMVAGLFAGKANR